MPHGMSAAEWVLVPPILDSPLFDILFFVPLISFSVLDKERPPYESGTVGTNFMLISLNFCGAYCSRDINLIDVSI